MTLKIKSAFLWHFNRCFCGISVGVFAKAIFIARMPQPLPCMSYPHCYGDSPETQPWNGSPSLRVSKSSCRCGIYAAGGCEDQLLYLPWHFLYFSPLPQGHGSLRPTLGIPIPKPTGGFLSGSGWRLGFSYFSKTSWEEYPLKIHFGTLFVYSWTTPIISCTWSKPSSTPSKRCMAPSGPFVPPS